MRQSAAAIGAACILAAVLAGAAPAAAQSYPSKPVRMVTGGAGTFHDIVARQLAQRLAERWGQAVVIENQPAVALTVGTGAVSRAQPDGYTLVLSDRSALAVAPHLFKSVPYTVPSDFAPVTLVATASTMLVAHPSVPAATLAELLAYARQQPDIQFATAGPGTNNHIAMEVFKQATGVNAVPVHYKGGGASTLALVSGEVKVGFGAVPSSLPHVKAGRLKAFIVTSPQRLAAASDVPTAAEAGLPGLEREFWIGLLAPARTPPDVVAKLNRDVAEILMQPDMQAILAAQGARAVPGTPQQFSAWMASESDAMQKLIAQTGMRAE